MNDPSMSRPVFDSYDPAVTKRTAVVRIDATNGDRLVGAAQGTVTISAPKPGRP